MPDTYIQLPDQSYVHIPEGTAPDKLQEFRNRLASQTANLKTGAGMQQKAQEQATAALPQPKTGMEGTRPTPGIRHGQAEQAEKAGPYVIGAAGAALPILGPMAEGASLGQAAGSAARAIGRTAVGSAAGGYIGGQFGPTGKTIGRIVGGLGGAFMKGSPQEWLDEPEPETGIEKGPSIPIRNSPNFDAAEYNAGRRGIEPSISSPREEGIEGAVPKFKGRLVLSEQEANAADRMQELAKQRASERGMIFAGGGVPAEGRSVPRFSTPTQTFEYPGPKFKKVIP